MKLDISTRLLSKIFWEIILRKSDELNYKKQELNHELQKLDKLIDYADYKTGSISLSTAWCLYSSIRFFQPKRILEIGTFIGKSTLSMCHGMEDLGIVNGEIFTCDFSNNITLPINNKTKIYQYQRKSSTEMLRSVNGIFDFCFFDGRLIEEDLILFSKLINQNSIIALDDFEGMEKGVINLINLRRIPEISNWLLIYPPSEDILAKIGFFCPTTIAFLIPASLINFVNQG